MLTESSFPLLCFAFLIYLSSALVFGSGLIGSFTWFWFGMVFCLLSILCFVWFTFIFDVGVSLLCFLLWLYKVRLYSHCFVFFIFY